MIGRRSFSAMLIMLLAIDGYGQKADATGGGNQVRWITPHITTIRSIEMESDASDLNALGTIAVSANVIALGEVTHGSHEIYEMKSKMVKYLVERQGYNVFVIEASMAEAFRLNEYTIHGQGDAKTLLKGMHLKIWGTEEMLDLVNWMKNYNHAHRKKVIFTGMDMQYYEGALAEINKSYMQYTSDTTTLNALSRTLKKIDEYRNKHYRGNVSYKAPGGDEQVDSFCRILSGFAKQNIRNKEECEWFLENISIVTQYAHEFGTGGSNNYRDSCMAENFMWVYHHYAGSKFILWAHNEHICKGMNFFNISTGQVLEAKLKHAYVAVGFTFYKGSFTSGGNTLHTATATTAPPGTYEHLFHSIGQPAFMLNLRKIPGNSHWNAGMRFRTTGIKELGNDFMPKDIKQAFDIMVFIDKSTNSTLLN